MIQEKIIYEKAYYSESKDRAISTIVGDLFSVLNWSCKFD